MLQIPTTAGIKTSFVKILMERSYAFVNVDSPGINIIARLTEIVFEQDATS